MIREEILAMKPGRELDALVAEKVMGWQIYHYDKDVPERCYYMLVDEKFDPVADWSNEKTAHDIWHAGERKTEEEAWEDNKHFSTDISAAWEVVEKIKQQLQDVMIHDDPYHGCKVTISLISWATAKTAPEAICKAALLACLEVE